MARAVAGSLLPRMPTKGPMTFGAQKKREKVIDLPRKTKRGGGGAWPHRGIRERKKKRMFPPGGFFFFEKKKRKERHCAKGEEKKKRASSPRARLPFELHHQGKKKITLQLHLAAGKIDVEGARRASGTDAREKGRKRE